MNIVVAASAYGGSLASLALIEQSWRFNSCDLWCQVPNVLSTRDRGDMHNGSISRWDQYPQDRWPCWIKTWGVGWITSSRLLVHFVRRNSRLEVTHQTYRLTVYNYSEQMFIHWYFFFRRLLLAWHGVVHFFQHALHTYHVVSSGFSWHKSWPFDPLPGSYLAKLCQARRTDTQICFM